MISYLSAALCGVTSSCPVRRGFVLRGDVLHGHIEGVGDLVVNVV